MVIASHSNASTVFALSAHQTMVFPAATSYSVKGKIVWPVHGQFHLRNGRKLITDGLSLFCDLATKLCKLH